MADTSKHHPRLPAFSIHPQTLNPQKHLPPGSHSTLTGGPTPTLPTSNHRALNPKTSQPVLRILHPKIPPFTTSQLNPLLTKNNHHHRTRPLPSPPIQSNPPSPRTDRPPPATQPNFSPNRISPAARTDTQSPNAFPATDKASNPPTDPLRARALVRRHGLFPRRSSCAFLVFLAGLRREGKGRVGGLGFGG